MKRFFVLSVCVGALSLGAGCSPSTEPAPAANHAAGGGVGAEEGHHHAPGPHGGTVTDWGGGKYHVEFAVDHDKKEATVYILGSDEKSPLPIKADAVHLTINDPTTQLILTPQPLEGEPAGTSSRFVGTHDTIGIVKEFAGTITAEVDGTPYSGDFEEEPHGASGHKH